MYSDAGTGEEEGDAIGLMAKAALAAYDGHLTESDHSQMIVLLTAWYTFKIRNDVSHDAWKHVGALGNLLTLWGKIMRLMNTLWWEESPSKHAEKPVDNLVDAINYAVFTIRSLRNNDMRGH